MRLLSADANDDRKNSILEPLPLCTHCGAENVRSPFLKWSADIMRSMRPAPQDKTSPARSGSRAPWLSRILLRSKSARRHRSRACPGSPQDAIPHRVQRECLAMTGGEVVSNWNGAHKHSGQLRIGAQRRPRQTDFECDDIRGIADKACRCSAKSDPQHHDRKPRLTTIWPAKSTRENKCPRNTLGLLPDHLGFGSTLPNGSVLDSTVHTTKGPKYFTTKGLYTIAQGCRAAATLGEGGHYSRLT